MTERFHSELTGDDLHDNKPHALNSHTDVDTTGKTDGDALVWDSGAGEWVAGAVAGGVSSVDGETGAVDLSGDYAPLGHTHNGLAPTGGASGQILKKNSGTNYDYSWAADEAGTGGSSDLEGLSDVDLTSPATRDGLFYDGSNFVNQKDPAHFVAPVSKSATFTASLAEHAYLCNASGGAFTANLPTAVGNAGKEFVFKKTDSSANAITLDPNGSETINGDATVLLENQHETAIVYSDGSGWHISAQPYRASGNAGGSVPAGGSTGQVLKKDTGTNYDYSWQDDATGGSSGYRTLVELGSDVSNSTATYADITGLSFPVSSGQTYRFYALILYSTNATGTGAAFSVNGPAASMIAFHANFNGTTAITQTVRYYDAYDGGTFATATASATANIAEIRGIVKPSSSGTVAMRFSSDAAAATVTVRAGSTVEYW